MQVKLTRANNTTKNNTQWGENVTHETNGNGNLCGPGWLHYYEDEYLAVFMDPVHGNFGKNGRMWEVKVEGNVLQHADKSGCTKLTTIREI